MIKRAVALALVLLLSIESFAAVVSDNDGSAFITKGEFDSLKNSFQSQIDQYNTSIDSKIDGAIAAYLAGIKISANSDNVLFYSTYRNNNLRWLGSNDAYFYYWTNKNTYNLSYLFADEWLYAGGFDDSGDIIDSVNGSWAIKDWMLKQARNGTANGRRNFVTKNDDKWYWYGRGENYLETHMVTQSAYLTQEDYNWGGSDAGFVMSPFRWNAGATTLVDLSTTNNLWLSNLTGAGTNAQWRNVAPPPTDAAYQLEKTTTIPSNSTTILVFDSNTAQFLFDYDNNSKVMANSTLSSGTCYDLFFDAATTWNAQLRSVRARGTRTIAGTNDWEFRNPKILTMAEAQAGGFVTTDLAYGKTTYQPTLAPININKTSFSDIYANDKNVYSITLPGGTQQSINGYKMIAGVPLTGVTTDETQTYNWEVVNTGNAGNIYIKYNPFSSGVDTSQCLLTKELLPGSNRLNWTTDTAGFLWIKCDPGVVIDVEQSKTIRWSNQS